MLFKNYMLGSLLKRIDMKYFRYLFQLMLSLTVGLTCMACSDSDDDGGNVRFKVEPTEMTFDGDGGTQAFTVTASEEPTVTSNASWCSFVYQGVASNVYSYEVSVAANSEEERTTTIKVVAGTSMKEIAISQAKKEVVIPDVGMEHDATELAALMYAGINIGNTMECPGNEGAWSGTKVNEAYVRGLKAAGFNAVRIPCAWHSYIENSSTYTISSTWLERVEEVVSWCVANGMYVVLNSHWDGGWLEDNIFDASKEAAIVAEQTAIWTQIANKLNRFDEHLLFAACNEPGMNETSGGGHAWETDAEAVARVVKYEQAMIDAVRATGGYNARRCLIVQGLGTDISATNGYMSALPTDNVANRLMVEVHYYEPYQFCLMEEDASWGKMFYFWGEGNHVSGSDHNADWGEESWVKEQFEKMKAKYTDKGIPVIIGEYSAMFRTISEGQDMHDKSVCYYGEVVTREAKNHGCVPFYWETGSVINRTTGEVKKQDVVDGLMKGASEGKYPW